MERVVIFEKQIPDYLHDATGTKLKFSLLQYTPDKNIKVNLIWDPPMIKTHEKIQFIYHFCDLKINSNLTEMKYNFIIFQNEQKLFRDEN